MKKRRDISKFDKIGNLWHKIKNDSRIQQIYVIKEPQLIIRIYDRFQNKELGRMFVETYADVPGYNEQAYFISCELGKPIERMDKSLLMESLENYERNLVNNSQFNTVSSATRNRKKIVSSVQTKMLANKLVRGVMQNIGKKTCFLIT